MSVTPPPGRLHREPDFDLATDYDSLVMETCQLLDEANCGFSVGGFGQRDWPVDVAYDLSTVIEQLPAAAEDLRQGEQTFIDLYGQGVERCLSFTPLDGNLIEVRCTSRTGWIPEPSVEQASSAEVMAFLAGLAREFRSVLEQVCPRLAATEPFASW